jgi:hypothetical protein
MRFSQDKCCVSCDRVSLSDPPMLLLSSKLKRNLLIAQNLTWRAQIKCFVTIGKNIFS